MSPYKQKVYDKAFEDDHDLHINSNIQRQALQLYMKKKKLQAMKAIQYVMREKPEVFGGYGIKRKSPNEKKSTDNSSEIGSELSKSFKRHTAAKLTSTSRIDSYQSYNDNPSKPKLKNTPSRL